MGGTGACVCFVPHCRKAATDRIRRLQKQIDLRPPLGITQSGACGPVRETPIERWDGITKGVVLIPSLSPQRLLHAARPVPQLAFNLTSLPVSLQLAGPNHPVLVHVVSAPHSDSCAGMDCYGVFFFALDVSASPVAEMSFPAPAVALHAASNETLPTKTMAARTVEV